jgi:membrane-anchored protein YejM (alkaline phosphatase superfamily)
VFPEEFLQHVPTLEDITVATNTYAPNGTSFIEWESGAEGIGSASKGGGPTVAVKKEKAQGLRRAYYAAAAFSDSLLGELLAEVDRRGFANNTIVVMTSDHGWGLGEHNHWIKVQ